MLEKYRAIIVPLVVFCILVRVVMMRPYFSNLIPKLIAMTVIVVSVCMVLLMFALLMIVANSPQSWCRRRY